MKITDENIKNALGHLKNIDGDVLMLGDIPLRGVAETIEMAIEELSGQSSRSPGCHGDWVDVATELPPLEQVVFLDLGNGTVIIGGRASCHDGWHYGNTYGSIWWDDDDQKWDCCIDVDDDYQPVRWHSLPKPVSP